MNHDGMQTDAGILELIRDRLNIDVMDVDVDLIETGMVDSLALVTLITAVEEMFALRAPARRLRHRQLPLGAPDHPVPRCLGSA